MEVAVPDARLAARPLPAVFRLSGEDHVPEPVFRLAERVNRYESLRCRSPHTGQRTPQWARAVSARENIGIWVNRVQKQSRGHCWPRLSGGE